MNNYKILTINSISEWFQLSQMLNYWAFRGQSDASWNLKSSLGRLADKYHHAPDWLWHTESFMLRDFKRKAHLYTNDLPGNDFEWLALMQHHGCPTRMLDFTHSFFVASFFALESTNVDAAIWAVHIFNMHQQMHTEFGSSSHNTNVVELNKHAIDHVANYLSTDGVKPPGKAGISMLHVEPERQHERLARQQGLFLFPTDIVESFNSINDSMSQLEVFPQKNDLNPSNDLVVKILIPLKLRFAILSSLRNMNITADSLFPGLDGFARSMHSNVSLNIINL